MKINFKKEGGKVLRYLAVDIGGSKTRAVVFNRTMNEEKIYETIGFGVASDFCEDTKELSSLFSKIANSYIISSVVVNLGGKNKEQICSIAKDCFPKSRVSVYRESEGAAAIAFGKMNVANAVLLAGTGTISIAYDSFDNYIITGGWGMNIGDTGSGYYIGLEAIKESLVALDQNETLSPLEKEITGIDDYIKPEKNISEICIIRDKVRSGLFPLDRKRVASYAKIVAEHCEKGEKDALALMHRAGKEMANVVLQGIQKLLPFEVGRICVTGGLVNSIKFWQEEFEKEVRKRSSVKEFIYDCDGILLGTKILSIEQMEKGEE